MAYVLGFVFIVLTYHAIAEGEYIDSICSGLRTYCVGKHAIAEGMSCNVPTVCRALLRCIGNFLQQQRARRRVLPQKTKQGCTVG